MIRRTFCASAVFLLAAGLIHAQGDPKKDTEGDLQLRFHDGSTLKKVAFADKLTVATKFGKLTIETREIRKIEFGLQMSDEMTKKLDDALARLHSENFQMREAAAKELVAMGRYAYPALVKLTKGSDLEATRRIEALVKQLRDKLPPYQMKMKYEDVIRTGDSVIAGRIEGTIRVRTRQFGEVNLDLGELQSIRSMTGGSETALAVDAAKHGTANAWMDTGVTVEADSTLLVTAAGKVDLQAQFNPGQQLSGPDGNSNFGMGGTFLPGQLVGKIGENGTPFAIGERFEGTPTTEGKLYLLIWPVNNFNRRFKGKEEFLGGGATGTYTVQVTTGG